MFRAVTDHHAHLDRDLPALVEWGLLCEIGEALLCKPQFEGGRQVAARGRGVVRDRGERRAAIQGVLGALEDAGAAIMGIVSSPILGPAGNAEFLLHARVGARSTADMASMVEAALDEAEAL